MDLRLGFEESPSSSSSPSLSSSNGGVIVAATEELNQLKISDSTSNNHDGDHVQVTCFSDVCNDATLYFQIIRLQKQIYAWIGCNSAKFGNLYAGAPTRPNNTATVSSLTGGSSDDTGFGIARRLVLRTGLNIVLACNIPKNSPMLEAAAEKKLVEKLISLGYTKQRSQGPSS